MEGLGNFIHGLSPISHRSISFGIFSSDMSNHLKERDNFNFFWFLNKNLKFNRFGSVFMLYDFCNVILHCNSTLLISFYKPTFKDISRHV